MEEAVAFLLERHGHAINEAELDTITDWTSVADITGFDSINEIGVLGTWPRSNDSIIHYQTAGEPYIDTNGFSRYHIIDQYFPVTDWESRTVYNPETEETESFIGRTVAGWASYTLTLPPPQVYESSKTPATEEDYPGITYERFPRPRRMYVAKLEGTPKVNFGKASNWNEIGKSAIGHVDYGTEIYILGQARHPMPPIGAVFYMDAAAMGTFSGTGRVAATHGYAKSDLHDHIFAPATPEVAEPEPEKEPEAEPISELTPEPESQPLEITFDSLFKEGYKGYRNYEGRIEYHRYVAVNIPKQELFNEIITVHDKKMVNGESTLIPREVEAQFAWIRDLRTDLPRRFRNHAEVDIAGEFPYKGKRYGMPARTLLDGERFGIDMDWLVLKSELESTATTKEERKALKTLKVGDYVAIARGRTEATFNQVIDVVKRRHRKTNK